MSVSFFTTKVVEDILGEQLDAPILGAALNSEIIEAETGTADESVVAGLDAPAEGEAVVTDGEGGQAVARVVFEGGDTGRRGIEAQLLADIGMTKDWGVDAGETTIPASALMGALPTLGGEGDLAVDGGEVSDSGDAAAVDAAAVSALLALPTDDLFSSQWHLNQTTSGSFDLNVTGVWDSTGTNYTGAGVEVAVIDDAVQRSHHQLDDNYSSGKDWDFDNGDTDPSGVNGQNHGTAVAGIIGAARDGVGTVGVAYDATLFGFQVYGYISDTFVDQLAVAIDNASGLQSEAGSNREADVVNMSLGTMFYANYFDEYLTTANMSTLNNAIDNAVVFGRGGLGTILVKSAGNSRGDNIDANASSWNANFHTISVAAVDQDGFVSYYSSHGANILVSGFGTPGEVVTTDRLGSEGYTTGDYTYGFNGTSAAAPMVSGVVALMLEANPDLGWRDVQQILAYSARHVGSDVGSGMAGSEEYPWYFNGADTWNGGGLHFSNDYGFGLVDAHAAVRLAETWGTPSKTSANDVTQFDDVLNTTYTLAGFNTTNDFTFSNTSMFIEHVEVSIYFSSWFDFGDLDIELIAPDGTVAHLIDNIGENDGSTEAAANMRWDFTTPSFMGMDANGTWTLRLLDQDSDSVSPITITDIDITMFGTGAAGLTDATYVFTNEFSDYDGLFGHATAIVAGSGTDTLNASPVTSGSTINLLNGSGTIDGVAVTISGIENVYTGDGYDFIRDNYISGGNMIDAGRGNDTVQMGDANIDGDVYQGGAGTDTFDASIYSWGTAVTIDIGNGFWSYSAGSEDVLGFENIKGADGVGETLLGTSGQNFISGNGGDDTINGLAGTDYLYGGLGADVIDGGLNNDYLYGGDGNDTILGGSNNDLLSGNDDNDSLNGGTGTDTLYGGGGNDILTYTSGESYDHMYGGLGNDSAYFDWILDMTFDLASGFYTDATSGNFTLDGVENIFAGHMNDTLIGDSNDNILSGGEGNDTLSGGEGVDTLYGGNGNDVLSGDYDVAIDQLYGGSGKDRFYVTDLAPLDNIFGGGGADSLYLNPWSVGFGFTVDLVNQSWDFLPLQPGYGPYILKGVEKVFGSQYADEIFGDDANNIFTGELGNDTIFGGKGSDVIDGGDDDDVLHGENGGDSIKGGLGDDLISGGYGADTLKGSGGDDTLDYSADTDGVTIDLSTNFADGGQATGDVISTFENVLGGLKRDFLTGDGGANFLKGDNGNDIINGLGGDDELTGNNGFDKLNGGEGNDTLTGGIQADQFLFDANFGNDEIKDFEVGIDVVKIFGGYSSSDISLANVGTSVIATLDPTGDTIKFKGLQDTDINSFADFIFL